MDRKILKHFQKTDSLLYSTAMKVKVVRKLVKGNQKEYFLELCDAIVGQQLSGRAADTIFARFKLLFPKAITPKGVLEMPDAKLRDAGLSNAKVKYIKNLAAAVETKKLDLEKIESRSDDEVKRELLQIKGIGPWTAEMFMIFTLGRLDVFSHGDLGLRKGIKKIYGFKKDPKIRTVERIVSKWSPYRSYASLVLWKYLDS